MMDDLCPRRRARTSSLIPFCAAAFLVAFHPPIFAASIPHPIVPGFERFHSASGPDAEAGLLLLGELQCLACHSDDGRLQTAVVERRAPVLDGVGSRVDPKFLREFLVDPARVKPGTPMPNLFTGLSPEQAREKAEALVHLLASTGGFGHTFAGGKAAQRGEKLFHRIGCAACHGAQRPDAERPASAVPLGRPSDKYSVPGLASFLGDPLKVRPSGRMPDLGLSEDEARDVAAWFLRDVPVSPNFHYDYYEGEWDRLPDFAALKPKTSGPVGAIDLHVAERDRNYAVRFAGYLRIAEAGEYTFHLLSDDGSRITIDGAVVVDNDGDHGPQSKSGGVHLAPGAHPFLVEFYQHGGGAVLQVEYEGPGVTRRTPERNVTASREAALREEDRFVPDPRLVARGRELFSEMGCASCHQLRLPPHGDEGRPLASTLKAPKLPDLDPAKGCLAPENSAGAPFYGLSPRQRESIAAALSGGQPAETGPETTIARTMTAFNCYACHERGKAGGPEEENNRLFETSIQEMGEEGRIPPALDGVGDKLRADWLEHLFAHGAGDRPYMLTRMPRFGVENVGPLVKAFAAVDEKTEAPRAELDLADYRVKSTGRHLVGEKALSCIKCHNFAGRQATGIQATDLTRITRRLREDWFYRYMINPQVYRPGTRMPSAWPAGQSTIRNVLDGSPGKQLEAIWSYLADGDQAAVPLGLAREAIELVPTAEPIIYRNFIEGAGPRAIAVGYPEKLNLAFDANACALRLLWHGAFIDASKHWIGRGPGFQSPLGDHLLTLPAEAPVARLERADSPWPAASPDSRPFRFRGYRLNSRRQPTFLYESDSLLIEDTPVPVAAEPDASLERRLTVHPMKPSGRIHYRAAAGKTIEAADDGWFVVDGALRVRLQAPAADKPFVRKAGEGYELLLPVDADSGRVTIVQNYVW